LNREEAVTRKWGFVRCLRSPTAQQFYRRFGTRFENLKFEIYKFEIQYSSADLVGHWAGGIGPEVLVDF